MQFGTFRYVKSLALATCATAALMNGGGAFAQNDETHEFEIAAQDLDDALAAFSVQGDAEVYWLTEEVAGKKTEGLNGSFTKEEAVEKLLDDAGVDYRIGENDVILVGDAYIREASLEERNGPFRVAQLDQESSGDVARAPGEREKDEEEDERDQIVVTGTNIRGISPESSPTRTFSREDVQISGAATAQDFIKTLTANFGGGANANIPAGLPDNTAAFNSGTGGSFGSGINLRGLGSGATLVLLNGHRIAPASAIGDFTDISMIPASAIGRVETLTDGASSIYGSDAVAGVVNFILRDDFDGVEAAFRYGLGTENSAPQQYRANFTGGKSWRTGNAFFAYEYFNQDELKIEDRSFVEHSITPNYLLPSQERHSVIAAANQEVAQNLELFADFAYSNRQGNQLRTNIANTAQIFDNDFSSKSITAAAGGALNLGSDWVFNFSGTVSNLDSRNIFDLTSGAINSQTVSDTNSMIGTADAVFSGTIARLPGGNLKISLGGHYRAESFDLQTTSGTMIEGNRKVYAAFGEAFIPIIGSENRVVGINRLELNVSGRFEDYSDFGSTTNPKVAALWSPFDGLNLRGSYSTSFKAPALGLAFANNLSASLRSMTADNVSFGLTAADPSIADAIVLFVTGTDKNLKPETSRAITAGADLEKEWGAHNFELSITFFDIDFEDRLGRPPIPGNVIFLDAPNIAFNDPDAFPEGFVVFDPSQDLINDIINSLDRPLFDQGFALNDVTIINRVVVSTNLSRTAVRGLDFDASYTFDMANGAFVVGLDGTFLKDFQQQAAETSPTVEQVNTLFNPVDLKLRTRMGYTNDNFNANIFLNYVDDYFIYSSVNATPVDSWTTVDLNLSYAITSRAGSILNNSVFRLSVINLFDRDPPSAPTAPSLRVDGFDPTNASPLGRFIAFEVTKRF